MARSGWAGALAGAALVAVVSTSGVYAGTCVLPAWGAGSPIGTDVYGASSAGGGGFVYAGGGYSFSGGGVVNQFRRWSPATNTWTSLANIPTAVSMASLLYDATGNRLFLFGGTDPNTGTVYSLNQVYNVATNTWSAGPAMPDIRAFMSSGVIGNKMYLVGGYSTGSVDPSFNQTWEYDPVLGTYTTKAVLPATLGGAGSAVSGGRLYVMGGRNISNDTLNTNYEYDPVANTWATKAVLPTPINVPGGTALSGQALCNGDIILVGGGNPFLTGARAMPLSAGAMKTTGITQLYNVPTNTWSAGPALPQGRSFLTAAQAADALVAIGGYSGTTTVTTVDRIQGPPLPVGLDGITVK